MGGPKGSLQIERPVGEAKLTGFSHFWKDIDAAGREAHDPRNSRRSVFGELSAAELNASPNSFAPSLNISSGIESASRKAQTLSKSAAAGLASATSLNASEKVTVTDGWSSASLPRRFNNSLRSL